MDFEFDKEIDFLLRQAAHSGTALAVENPSSEHLDADEIAAFAENALPEKARQNYILHFADCEKCRRNLALAITLNHETPTEIVHAKELNLTAATAAKIPWYRKFFAVPTLAYALGALILLFAGFGIFTVLQRDSTNSQMSAVSERQIGGKGMSSDGDAATVENYSGSAMSNSAANTNAAISTNSAASLSVANANAMTARREPNAVLNESAAGDKTLNKPTKTPVNPSSFSAAPPPPASQIEELPLNGRKVENISPTDLNNAETQNRVTQNQSPTMPDTRNGQNAPMSAPQARTRQSDGAELLKREQENSSETKISGGRKFIRSENIWTDAAYRGQTTTNITRGTDEYKKLDSGLRGIVENLGGTVIIVWKAKAYRIK